VFSIQTSKLKCSRFHKVYHNWRLNTAARAPRNSDDGNSPLATLPPLDYNPPHKSIIRRVYFMIDVNELRKGVTFELDEDIFKVLEYSHHKPGRGKATIRVKARNLRTGATIDKSFNSSDRVQDIRLDYRNVQFLYFDNTHYHFMDLDTYEQPALSAEVLEDAVNYLIEGLEVKLTFYEGEPLDIDLPTTVDLEVTKAMPSVRGDTATGVTKQVTVETGLEVDCPSFVETGDVIRVDTRSGTYVTRV
jgi:elongation factor P